MLQPIIDIAEICARHGVRHVVLSPGSRCAPLTLAMVRHPKLTTYTISDERSAAFIALGLSLATKRPTVLVCTSGSAALNYAPGVAEAFFQKVPMIVLTADRPPEWIDQQDGQTIRQEQVFGRNVKASHTLPTDLSHPDSQWQVNRVTNEALLQCMGGTKGPVHINVPLREPFYPKEGEAYGYSDDIRIICRTEISPSLASKELESLIEVIGSSPRILLVPGQQDTLDSYASIRKFCEMTGAVIVSDLISNHSQLPEAVRYHDFYLNIKEVSNSLKPDLVISYGGAVISKNLKTFLRSQKPQEHWHISTDETVADTFQSLTRHIPVQPLDFFGQFDRFCNEAACRSSTYAGLWKAMEGQAESLLSRHDLDAFTEFTATKLLLESLPSGKWHFSNSMPVRYANMLNITSDQVSIYCNRGTSGIDGCTSTAVGMALAVPENVFLVSGDLAFFYDRNALWNRHLPDNLCIIVMNNHAGGIFRMVEGANRQPELEEYFETEQRQDAKQTALQHGLSYASAKSREELEAVIHTGFLTANGPRLLEVFVDSSESAEYLKSLQAKIRNEIISNYIDNEQSSSMANS